jgi:hypothetical protein
MQADGLVPHEVWCLLLLEGRLMLNPILLLLLENRPVENQVLLLLLEDSPVANQVLLLLLDRPVANQVLLLENRLMVRQALLLLLEDRLGTNWLNQVLPLQLMLNNVGRELRLLHVINNHLL